MPATQTNGNTTSRGAVIKKGKGKAAANGTAAAPKEPKAPKVSEFAGKKLHLAGEGDTIGRVRETSARGKALLYLKSNPGVKYETFIEKHPDVSVKGFLAKGRIVVK
jgi:hypothetical protein